MKKSNTIILTVALLMAASTNTSAQAINIQEYCSDMREALGASGEWYRQCVATNEVRRKYQRQAEVRKRTNASSLSATERALEFWKRFEPLGEAMDQIEDSKDSEAMKAFFVSRIEPLFANDCGGDLTVKKCAEELNELRRFLKIE